MALRLNDATALINRTTNLVSSASNYTACCWHRAAFLAVSPDYVTVFASQNAVPDAGIGIYADAQYYLFGDNNVGSFSSTPVTVPITTWTHFAYVRSGTANRYYVNGVLIDTDTLDMSLITFAELVLGNDGFSVVTSPLDFQYFREWDAALTVTQIGQELHSTIPVRLTNLITDTPLIDDLLDDSGNGNDWTGVGNFSFTVPPNPPGNTTALTATPLGDLPVTITQDAVVDGLAYPLWFSFIAPATGVVGVWGYGDFTPIYEVRLTPFDGPASAPTIAIPGFSFAVNVPIQFKVTGGNLYLLRCVPNAANPTPAVLTLTLEMFVPSPVTSDAIFITDDTPGLPAALVSPTADLVQDFLLDFPAGESGFGLTTRYYLMEDIDLAELNLKLYSYNSPFDGFTLLATIPFNVENPAVIIGYISGNKTDRFYASDAWTPGTSTISAIELDGTISQTWVIADNAVAICISPDESILYFHDGDFGPVIQRYDLVNSVLLSPLATIPNGDFFPIRQILCLNDGSVLIGGYDINISPSYYVYRYSAAGVLLNLYDFSGEDLQPVGQDLEQVFLAADDPTTFNVWLKIFDAPSGTGFNLRSLFLNVRTSDGAILSRSEATEYESATYSGVRTPTPTARFGHSNSCVALILYGESCPGEVVGPRIDGIAAPYPPSLCAGGSGTLGPPRTGV